MAIALVVAALGPLWNLATNTVTIPDRWAPWVWTLALSLAVVAVVIEVWGGSGGPDDGIGLDEAAARLATAVGAQWRREEDRRRVHDPLPVPVRWRNAPEALMDHRDNYCCTPAGTTAEPLDLTGRLEQVAEIYRRVPSRRLVILGGTRR